MKYYNLARIDWMGELFFWVGFLDCWIVTVVFVACFLLAWWIRYHVGLMGKGPILGVTENLVNRVCNECPLATGFEP